MNIQFAGYLYDRLSLLTLALQGLLTWVGLMVFFPKSCSFLLWNHHILVFSMWVKPGPLCRTLRAADDSVVASLLLICMIKICQQIAPGGVKVAGSAAEDWPQLGPLAKLPQAMTEASLGQGQWSVFVTVLLTAWRTQPLNVEPSEGKFYNFSFTIMPQSEFNITVPIDLQLKSIRIPEL